MYGLGCFLWMWALPIASNMMQKREAPPTAASLRSLSSLFRNENPYMTGGSSPKIRNDKIDSVACNEKLSLRPSVSWYRSSCSFTWSERSFFRSTSCKNNTKTRWTILQPETSGSALLYLNVFDISCILIKAKYKPNYSPFYYILNFVCMDFLNKDWQGSLLTLWPIMKSPPIKFAKPRAIMFTVENAG